MATNIELIKKIKQFFEDELVNKNDAVKQFSDDVITLAYQKISENLKDIIQNEEDPMVLSELLQNYMQITKLIEEKDTQKQQILLKFYEQLTKYEQNRFY